MRQSQRFPLSNALFEFRQPLLALSANARLPKRVAPRPPTHSSRQQEAAQERWSSCATKLNS